MPPAGMVASMLHDEGPPRFPPTLIMNDYTRLSRRLGVIAALRRRAKEGGSYHIRASLVRAAMWSASLGRLPDLEFDANARTIA